jgi:hypothetical protein
MKLHEVKKPKDGDHPILYDLIRGWLAKGMAVKFDSAGLIGMVTGISVDLQTQKAVHGQVQTYQMEYQAYISRKGTKVPVLSKYVEATWLYPAELEDATIREKTDDTVFIDIPDYVNHPDLLKDRK